MGCSVSSSRGIVQSRQSWEVPLMVDIYHPPSKLPRWWRGYEVDWTVESSLPHVMTQHETWDTGEYVSLSLHDTLENTCLNMTHWNKRVLFLSMTELEQKSLAVVQLKPNENITYIVLKALPSLLLYFTRWWIWPPYTLSSLVRILTAN